MKVIVCIKGIYSRFPYENNNKSDITTINPYDLFALNDVLSVARNNEFSTVCLSMGEQCDRDILIQCLAMGADQGVLLSDFAFYKSDTIAKSYLLALAIKKLMPCSLIVCGNINLNCGSGQFVYGLSQRLQIPCIKNVKQIVEIDESSAVIKIFSGGFIETVRIRLPAIIAYQELTINQEIISLLDLKKAKKKGVSVLTALDLGADIKRCGVLGSKIKVLNMSPNHSLQKSAEVKMINGSSTEKASLIKKIIEGRV